MGTREKLVALEDLPSRIGDANWLAVVGHFDPLTLAQAKHLADFSGRGRSLLAVVEPDNSCLLPVEARATLVAALRSVQLVVIAEAASLPSHPQIELVKDEDGERKRSAEFVEFIRKRQRAQ